MPIPLWYSADRGIKAPHKYMYQNDYQHNIDDMRYLKMQISPDNKVHGANVGPTWDRQDPGGPHVGHMNFAIWVILFIG